MFNRSLAAAIVAVVLVVPAGGASAAPGPDDATRLRVFLTDGSSLVSYGEPARVGDRIIFSIPTATTPNPPLHLVDLPASRVDWDRTNRYGASARASHYVETQAEADYLALSNDIVQALNDVAQATEPAQRLAIVERARRTLAEWPSNHYNYRQGEVRQMVSMLDDAIADLRAATGPGRFDLSLAAFLDPPTIPEPLLPPPTLKETIDQMLTAARIVDTPAERESLLVTAIAAIDRDKDALPADWAAGTRSEAEALVQTELRFDRAYKSLTARTMAAANRRARLIDVRGLERLLRGIPQRDAVLGAKRPDAVNSLIEAVQAKLDLARQVQLARDRWALRAPVLRRYRVAIRTPLDLFSGLKPSLENIKSLSGSTPAALAATQRAVTRIVKLASEVTPPDELAAAHALLISAVQMAGTAAQIRREATIAGDMARAWDASSAAAGALMLGAKARSEIQTLLRPPQLR
ncbi:MAG: hypothetical protein HY048_04500 [Acidobacteria bacterium]|nr:hypothetical protein [Acidobacteriota bacterium]